MKKKIIKKQKIKVPAYKDAGTIDVGAELAGGLDHATVGMELPDKLKPSYDYNLDVEPKMNTTKAAAIAEGAVTGLTSIANSAFGTSGVTTSKQAAAKSISDTLSSAGTGMKIGRAFGPIGAGVGFAAGALIGAIGQKGKKAEMQSFTDYDEGTLGTGLIGAFQNDDLREEYERIKQNAYANRDAVRGTNYLQNEYLQKYGGMSTGTFAGGGVIPFEGLKHLTKGMEIPTRLVYVDDGELIKTPQGETLEVPEEGKPTDSNLVNLPEGSRILSDSLKVPGTKKTFAQLGKELMNRKTSKGTDKYAENSKMLNDRNNQQIHDELFAYQEQVKQQKGIKPKTKTVGILAAEKGLEVEDYDKDPEYSYYHTNDSYTDVISPSRRELFNAKIKNAMKGITPYIGEGLSKLGELVPTFMNLWESDPEKVQANYNPYSTAITNTLGNRRYNIDKERQEILENRALMNRNVARTNTTTGANLAFALNSALQDAKNIANAYRYADNVNAQYAKEYVDAMNNLGQQWAAETNRVQEANAANKAAVRNIRRQGATQMSSWLQRNRAEKNKRNSDLAMLNLYKPFLEAGTPRENMSEFLKYYDKLIA